MKENENEWKEKKAKIRTTFARLSDSTIEGLNGHMDQLTGMVQKVYGYDKVKAEAVCKPFINS